MFEKEAEEYQTEKRKAFNEYEQLCWGDVYKDWKKGAESTLRKVIKYFSTIVLDENCGGYFSRLLESEEELQKLAKELENV